MSLPNPRRPGWARLVLAAMTIPPSLGRKMTVKNSCGTTIWPGMHTGGTNAPDFATGWMLPSGKYVEFDVADTWTAGRIWARTGCTIQDGKFQCLTGGCGQGEKGDVTCQVTNQPPATLAEFTLAEEGEDNYDVSLVDGFNIPLVITPSDSSCTNPMCETNINTFCPPLLRTGIDQKGQNLGCLAACNAGFGQETFGNRACCSGGYNDPDLCAICGVDYYDLFKNNCNTSYAVSVAPNFHLSSIHDPADTKYAYDEKSKTALWTCKSSKSQNRLSDYLIEFCPGGTDYVGPISPSEDYIGATATCTSKLTAFSATFSVNPSPTTTATAGTLKVVATVAPGVDGAAAMQVEDGYGSYAISQSTAAVTTSSTSKAAAVVSTASNGLVYGGHAITSSAAAAQSCGAETMGTDGKVTRVFAEVDGTTLLEIHDRPTQSTDQQQVHPGPGGQWLEAVPISHQKRRGMHVRSGWW